MVKREGGGGGGGGGVGGIQIYICKAKFNVANCVIYCMLLILSPQY